MKLETLFCIVFYSVSYARDLTQERGHLKPFGFTNSTLKCDEVEKFPSPDVFFRNYVFPKRPLVMRNAAKISPAFKLWTDDYFLQVQEPRDHVVSVETEKKENRKQDVHDMPFTEFVGSYNNSGIYMVNPVPKFISQDIVLPCCMQCPFIVEEKLVENIMWFSSGGTKSVVHTDSVENINCLYRGDKQFVMVDPDKYGDKVDLDHPEGSYSGVDVDSVDYTKYPGLADVEFYTINITAGDCLFIPYKWIHQVRSFDSNLAVNIWWNHFIPKDVSLESCNSECDLDLTLKTAEFRGFDQVMESVDAIKEHVYALLSRLKNCDYHSFLNGLIGDDIEFLGNNNIPYDSLMRKIFQEMDKNKDGSINEEELDKMDEQNWLRVQQTMDELSHLIKDAESLDNGEFRFKDEL
ncbi:tRNA wybutosine-synthesizing protein 5-like [Saccostrea echinata]|uniref:tRNA wybutosine-synthesizing protein 5-like n=1 Tax=Saccostrea echinata TaxID=191078 RepID=UPI002A8287E7|nr:tRNA wybutosine-synthesizing protein 5-like [Saccostrea echinata]